MVKRKEQLLELSRLLKEGIEELVDDSKEEDSNGS